MGSGGRKSGVSGRGPSLEEGSKISRRGPSPVVQWLRCPPSNAGRPEFKPPGQGTNPHMPQLGPSTNKQIF